MTDYVYTSGGFPSSPTSGDSLVINGAYYDWTGGAWKIRNATPFRSEFIATAMVHQLRSLPHLIWMMKYS